jgi:hypothetical protein
MEIYLILMRLIRPKSSIFLILLHVSLIFPYVRYEKGFDIQTHCSNWSNCLEYRILKISIVFLIK